MLTVSPASHSTTSSRLEIRKTSLFQSTNQLWNDLRLNRSWAIGSLNHLFRISEAKTYEDWEAFYFRSGEERKQKLQELPLSRQILLQTFTLSSSQNRRQWKSLTPDEMELNTHYGRTQEELMQIATCFSEELISSTRIQSFHPNLCRDYVWIRVLDETFIGFQREIKTLKTLRKKYPFLLFKPAPAVHDSIYAVDIGVFHKRNLLFSIQVKSATYLRGNRQHITQAKEMNHRKNQEYSELYKVPVLYVYADSNGEIKNKNVFSEMEKRFPCSLSR